MSAAITLFNGTSSTGKTTTARMLQDIFPSPLFYLGLDTWIRESLSKRYWEPALNLAELRQDKEARLGTFILPPNTSENALPWPTVSSGPVSDAAIYSMYQTAVDLYQRGYWVIIDHVFLTPEWHWQFIKATQDCQRYLIKFDCDVTVLAQREKARANRFPDLYKGLAETIHNQVKYDFTIDTSHIKPLDAATSVLNFLQLEPICNSRL